MRRPEGALRPQARFRGQPDPSSGFRPELAALLRNFTSKEQRDVEDAVPTVGKAHHAFSYLLRQSFGGVR